MDGNKYKIYYPKVEVNKKNFEYVLERIKKCKNFDDKITLANHALRLATYHNTGYFISSFLENFYTDFAKNIELDNYDISFQTNSFLHVMTRGYRTGGHTRVVERWIDNAPEGQKHSVVFTSPNSENMEVLESLAKEKRGDCIYFNPNWRLKEKALRLRRLGMEYQYIILHTHMEDPTATVAFGTENFTRPVIFYNHASHMFWIGKSIADIVLDIISNDDVTKRLKGIDNSFPIGVPSGEIVFSATDKKEVRRRLGLPVDKKIIVSSGSDFKYLPICDDNFYDIFSKVIDEDTYCYMIGLDKKKWEDVYIKSNKHIIPLGYINYNEGYTDYLKAADLYLDSYPLCGATATMDAITSGTPALSLSSIYPPNDYLAKTQAFCREKDDFIKKAKKILNDKNFSEQIHAELKASLIKYQSKDVWNKNVSEMLRQLPQKHTVKILNPKDDINEINDLAVYVNVITDKNFREETDVSRYTEENIKNILKAKPKSVKVSVIVPVYNAEKYLNKCLDSLINQTLKDIEIIVIDDFSTDNSLKILEDYAKNDNRIKLIKQRENCGQGTARNLALNIAGGEYIMFLDADDWYENNACEISYNQITKNNNDVCLFNFYNYYDNSGNKSLYKQMTDAYSDFANSPNIKLVDLKTNYIRSMFSVMFIYKREFLNEHNIRYSTDRLGEDVIFLAKVYTELNTLSIIHEPLYDRRIIEVKDKSGGSSLDTTNWQYIFKVRKEGLDVIKESDKQDVLKAYIIYCIRSVMYWYRTYSQINKSILCDYYYSMQKFFRIIDKSYKVTDIKDFIDYDTYTQALEKKWQDFKYEFTK